MTGQDRSVPARLRDGSSRRCPATLARGRPGRSVRLYLVTDSYVRVKQR